MNISKSKDFINEFKYYLNKHLVKDYKEQIDLKFLNLITKWEALFTDTSDH